MGANFLSSKINFILKVGILKRYNCGPMLVVQTNPTCSYTRTTLDSPNPKNVKKSDTWDEKPVHCIYFEKFSHYGILFFIKIISYNNLGEIERSGNFYFYPYPPAKLFLQFSYFSGAPPGPCLKFGYTMEVVEAAESRVHSVQQP